MSPKSKKLQKRSQVNKIQVKKVSNSDKNIKDRSFTQSPSIVKKSRKVKELIKCFEADSIENIEARIDSTVVTEGEKTDAFKVLMSGRQGDTRQKTPVRKKVKRIDKVTSGSKSLMDNWVSKLCRKGD